MKPEDLVIGGKYKYEGVSRVLIFEFNDSYYYYFYSLCDHRAHVKLQLRRSEIKKITECHEPLKKQLTKYVWFDPQRKSAWECSSEYLLEMNFYQRIFSSESEARQHEIPSYMNQYNKIACIDITITEIEND